MDYTVKILMTEFVTHDMKRFIIEKPAGFTWHPGQGVEIRINHSKWKEEEGRPFTPTCLANARVLEFTIKRYPEHHGVTDKLHTLQPGDELLMTEPFGTINYKGPGTFIAAGAGLTPFLAILRHLASENKLAGNRLLFSNKTPADVICEKELRHYLGEHCLLTCTRENAPGYDNRRIDKAYLQEKISDFSQHFYVCGPDEFVESINKTLKELGASPDLLVFEQ